MPQHDQSVREGARLGLLVATGIWLWLAIVDALAGRPFHTCAALGGALTFTALLYLLTFAIVAAIHDAVQEPGLVIGVMFGSFMIEVAFVMLTVLLSHDGLGEPVWVRILGGNLIGAAVAWGILLRAHRVREELGQAETSENE